METEFRKKKIVITTKKVDSPESKSQMRTLHETNDRCKRVEIDSPLNIPLRSHQHDAYPLGMGPTHSKSPRDYPTKLEARSDPGSARAPFSAAAEPKQTRATSPRFPNTVLAFSSPIWSFIQRKNGASSQGFGGHVLAVYESDRSTKSHVHTSSISRLAGLRHCYLASWTSILACKMPIQMSS